MKKINICGIVAIPLLSLGNLIHLPFFLWLLSEQTETGYGYGTNIEMGALFVWIAEFLCMPLLIAGTVLFVLTLVKKASTPFIAVNATLLSTLVLQMVLTNAFMYF